MVKNLTDDLDLPANVVSDIGKVGKAAKKVRVRVWTEGGKKIYRQGDKMRIKIVVDNDRPVLVATLHNDANGGYVGAISDPLPLVVADNGALSLEEPVPWAPAS